MKIFAAQKDAVGDGFVWLKQEGLTPRSVVRIVNPTSGRSAYCEALQFDHNFLADYNQKPRFSITEPSTSIVMSAWYRAKLGGLATQQEYPLLVQPADGALGKLRMCLDHPQVVVRVSAVMGIVGVGLGLVGVVLGALSLC